MNDLLLKRVLYGISCRNYEAAAEAIPGAIGLSSSTVSRGFVQASAAKLREMQERDLSAKMWWRCPGREIIRRRNDGHRAGHHTFREKTLFGLRGDGHGEREGVDAVLRSLLARGLDSSQGLLVIIDGGKSLKAAVKKAFRSGS